MQNETYDLAANGWIEVDGFNYKRYDDWVVVRTSGGLLMTASDHTCSPPVWANEEYYANTPQALDAAWSDELARRNKPVLDPDGWTDLSIASEHTSGYYTYMNIFGTWNAAKQKTYGPQLNLGGFNSSEQAKQACEEHAKANLNK